MVYLWRSHGSPGIVKWFACEGHMIHLAQSNGLPVKVTLLIVHLGQSNGFPVEVILFIWDSQMVSLSMSHCSPVMLKWFACGGHMVPLGYSNGLPVKATLFTWFSQLVYLVSQYGHMIYLGQYKVHMLPGMVFWFVVDKEEPRDRPGQAGLSTNQYQSQQTNVNPNKPRSIPNKKY